MSRKVAEAFRTGKGVGWHEHSKCLFSGTERFFRPGYNANLFRIGSSLEGIEEKLKSGVNHDAATVRPRSLYGLSLSKFAILRI